MATANKSSSKRRHGKPEGSEPKRKSQREDEKIRDEAQVQNEGGAPIDPADEEFIEESHKD